MELKWLEDFLCLATTGSFSKAAETRNITQSAFSRRIMALEEWLGATLIDRTSHPVTLTDDGARFIETAQQSVQIFKKVRDDFYTQNRKRRPSLTVGIADHLSIHFFPQWLRSLEGESPQFFFDLITGIKSGASFFESLKFQEFDLLICYSSMIQSFAMNTSSFASLKLGAESLLPVAATTLLEKENYQFPGSANKPLPFISYKNYSSLTQEITKLATESDVAPIHLDTVMRSSSAISIKSFVLQEYGIAWLPESSVTAELESGALTILGDERHRIPLTIEIHHYTRNTKPEILAFWEQLCKVYAPG